MSTRFSLALVAAFVTLLILQPAPPVAANHLDFQEGDLFVSVGGGIVRRFDSAGEEVEDLDNETGSAEVGDMCFSEDGMFSMNFQDGSISRFDGKGRLIESRWASPGGQPESCVFDSDGNLYVGQDNDPGGVLLKFDSDGQVSDTFEPEIAGSGVDQIDLAADQCTMLYTSESGDIKAFDVCENEQLPGFAGGLGSACNNLRIRPNEEVLVACDNSVIRLDRDGGVIQTYGPPDVDADSGGLFALNLDNDGEHFYTATYIAGLVWRIHIESADGTEEPYIQTTVEGDSIGGIAIFGEITVAVAAAETDRPDIVRAVPDPTDISTDPEVVGTNAAFAVIVAILILLSAQIFNETIEENNREIEDFTKRYLRPLLAPFRAARDAWRGAMSGNPQAARIAGVGIILAGTGTIYGFLEPGFGFDSDGILLVISIAIALGTVTYVYSGMEGRVTERAFQAPAGVRVYPVAIVIAGVSVFISRLISFEPGIVYGFVASNVVLAGVALEERQKGRAVFVAALCLLAAFAVAWGLMIPFREWAESDDNPLAVVLETSSTLIVVGAVETLAFSMVPIEFTDGRKVWNFNRVAWFLLAVVLAFLFWHVLLVQDEAGFEAVGEQQTIVALIAVGLCVGLTAAVWGYFYTRRRREQAASAASLPSHEPAAEPAPGAAEPASVEPAGPDDNPSAAP